MGIIVAIIILVSAGVSFGAESTVPGDALYPVKTQINERVEGWLAVSQKAESEHQVKLALRRLEEAEKLKAQGRLDAGMKAELENEFKAHAEEADRRMDSLESEGKAEEISIIRANLETSIRMKSDLLGIVEADISGDSDIGAGVGSEETTDEEPPFQETLLQAVVETDWGNLKLEYEEGMLKLSGMLTRSTPCINWEVGTVMTKDMPSSNVSFNLAKKSTAEVCIQILGEPQEINVKVPNVSPVANIEVVVESKTVFKGKWK